MAIDLDCANCGADEHVTLVEALADTRRRLRCTNCGGEWLRGTAVVKPKPLNTFAELKARFPKPEDVDPVVMQRANELKERYLREVPAPDPRVAPYWERYQKVFTAQGLAAAAPQDFKDFANSNIGANPGNMSVFNDAWNEMGPERGADEVRRVIEYLLRGPETTSLEDRLTQLIQDEKSVGMKGFKEALLTKVLCITEPDRFLTILKYTGEAGKREIARSVYGLELPDPNKVTWTIGRLIIWSNDVLRTLIGDGFDSQQRAAAFLWWAKDQAATSAPHSSHPQVLRRFRSRRWGRPGRLVERFHCSQCQPHQVQMVMCGLCSATVMLGGDHAAEAFQAPSPLEPAARWLTDRGWSRQSTRWEWQPR